MVNKIDLTEIQNQINSRQLKGSEPSAGPQRNHEVEWNLWEQMTLAFPYIWIDREGEEPTEIWGLLLTEITPEQVSHGLKVMANEWVKDFPPTVIQFRQLCKPKTISPDGKNSRAYMSPDDPRLPENDPNSPAYLEPKSNPNHPDYRKRLGIESDSYKVKKKKAGNDELSKVKDLFN